MKKSKLFVLALDGTPFSLLLQLIENGTMPNLGRLIQNGIFRELHSVFPPVSASAWASFMTGKKPHEHGILGFVDKNRSSGEWYLPNANHLQGKSIWKKLSEMGKRTFVMNVPVTYPPEKINGISICGFLGNDISRGTYPPELGPLLKAKGYIIDANTELAKENPNEFMDHLFEVLEKRTQTMWDFYNHEPWDFFMAHIMETDRLHHFFWEYFEQGANKYHDRFLELYKTIDQHIGSIQDKLPKDTALLMLSDHGFCRLDFAVYLNRWLADNGYLKFNTRQPSLPEHISKDSMAYSLYPGRIYINTNMYDKNNGFDAPYEQLRNELIFKIQHLKDPVGNTVVKNIFRREEIFKNANDAIVAELPDLVVIAKDGYDLKGNLWAPSLFDKTIFNGMHTFENAFLFTDGIDVGKEVVSIDQLYAPIIEFFN